MANETVLSGDIGEPNYNYDNCVHVFYHPAGLNLDDTAILDGFIVTAGNADLGTGDHTVGSGMFNWASSPTLRNCAFVSNSAYGGTVDNTNSSPTLIDCTFEDNTSGYAGGGMNNYQSSPILIDCTFSGNWAEVGGGMSNWWSSPSLTGCTFEGNTAIGESGGAGGGMLNYGSSPALTDCAFVGNMALSGGGLYNWNQSAPVLIGCRFEGNSAQDPPYGNGGAVCNQSASPTFADCSFTGNWATAWGGAIFGNSTSATFVDCTFEGNSSEEGGAMKWVAYSSATLTNCSFLGNSASNGGAIYNYSTTELAFTNCTFSANSASNGGAIYNHYQNPTITNSTLWGDVPNEIYGGSPTVTYSDIQGGYTGEGNIDADPLWVDPDNGNYHLSPGSPCIDAGTNDAAYLPEYDFEGDSRVMDGDGDGTPIVDMGIDEVPPPSGPSMHVADIQGYPWANPGGFPAWVMGVRVVDQLGLPLGEVFVEATVWIPEDQAVRTRYSLPNGWARFWAPGARLGTYQICVDNLVLAGYTYNPGDNVVTCMDWQR